MQKTIFCMFVTASIVAVFCQVRPPFPNAYFLTYSTPSSSYSSGSTHHLAVDHNNMRLSDVIVVDGLGKRQEIFKGNVQYVIGSMNDTSAANFCTKRIVSEQFVKFYIENNDVLRMFTNATFVGASFVEYPKGEELIKANTFLVKLSEYLMLFTGSTDNQPKYLVFDANGKTKTIYPVHYFRAHVSDSDFELLTSDPSSCLVTGKEGEEFDNNASFGFIAK